MFLEQFNTNFDYSFETDIQNVINRKPQYKTDREGNIIYEIPRNNSVNNNNSAVFDNKYSYGGRTRGKWMKETISNTNPTIDLCISNITTKFRKSYS